MNYFGIAEYYRPLPELDHWLRRRVRRCYWKQWRKSRTKVRNLLTLGVPLRAAISVGMSRKSFWRLSKTYATQLGMTNQWLKEQGADFHQRPVGTHALSGYGPITCRNALCGPACRVWFLSLPKGCGGWRLDTSGYPIRFCYYVSQKLRRSPIFVQSLLFDELRQLAQTNRFCQQLT